MKKMLVCDYDGTFYVDDEDIKRNNELLKEKNFLFLIATGRSYLSFEAEKKKHNIECDYTIYNHGALITYKDKVIYTRFINNRIKNNIVKLLDIDDKTYIEAMVEKETYHDLSVNYISKMYIKYDNPKKADRVRKKIVTRYSTFVNVYYSAHGCALEIVGKGSNKSLAIKKVAKLEGVNRKSIYTVGDGMTDEKMIKRFNGYKMSKSSPYMERVKAPEVNSISELIKKL